MKRLKIGLNGFGRTARTFTRIALARNAFDIVAINTRKTQPDLMAYLLKYDTTYRRLDKDVNVDGANLVVDNKPIATTQVADPTQIPWGQSQVDVVVDATGAFPKTEELKKHLRDTVKKVVLSAPAKDEETPHVVLGVNENEFDFASQIISNCSCTTNSAAVMFKVLDEKFKVLSGFVSTVHAYTNDQSLQDDAHKAKTRSRAAAANIVPTTTGAAIAVTKTLPHLKGKIDGIAVRVPVTTVSFTDISTVVQNVATAEQVNAAFKEASEGPMKGLLGYESDALVSSDFIGSSYSSIFDANYTKVLSDHFVKVFGWYDNEWGYSTRLVDLVEKLGNYF